MPKIKFKVVTDYRKSCKIKEHSGYCCYYPKGAVVKAKPETIGILVFDTKKDAEEFKYQQPHSANWIILKVKGIGRGKRPKRMCNYAYVSVLYKAILEDATIIANKYWVIESGPKGTIAYREVKVLS